MSGGFSRVQTRGLTAKNAFYGAARRGTLTANGASAVVVSNALIGPNSVIVFGMNTVGGTPAGTPYESAARVNGTSFTVKAVAGDTSIYNYFVIG